LGKAKPLITGKFSENRCACTGTMDKSYGRSGTASRRKGRPVSCMDGLKHLVSAPLSHRSAFERPGRTGGDERSLGATNKGDSREIETKVKWDARERRGNAQMMRSRAPC